MWYIARTFQWVQIGRLLTKVDLVALVCGGGGSLILYWFLRAVRWQFLLRKMGVRISFLDVYLCTGVTVSFAIFTPFQSGELLKVELLKKYGMVGRFTGYGTFAVERVLDLVVLLSLGCVSLLTTVDILPDRRDAYVILAVILLAALGGLLVALKLRLRGKLGEFLSHIRECVRDFRTLLGAFLITCASWSVVALSWQIFLYSGGVNLGYTRSMALMAVVALISILSLIPGGLGISEASTTQILVHYGQAVPAAQAGTLVLRSYSILAIALGAGHLGAWQMVRHCRRRRVECLAAPLSGESPA
ncbi:MAG: lysylphosphatidylglycerol synthase transmembrane domain-containing protein [Tepidisphaeraceae bacterium]